MNLIEIIFILVIIGIIASNIALRYLTKELKDIPDLSRLSGIEIARMLTSKITTNEPHIIKKSGSYLDSYNYERNVIKLSDEVFDGTDMYAAVIAFKISTRINKNSYNILNKLISLVVLSSYFLIIISAFANKESILNLGLSMFIIGFLIQLFILLLIKKDYKKDIDDLEAYLVEKHIISPTEVLRLFDTIVYVIELATYPYRFITYFR